MNSRSVHVVGLVVAIVIVLVLAAVLKGGEHFRTLALVCGGFVIGWVTAFIRFVFVERVDEKTKVLVRSLTSGTRADTIDVRGWPPGSA